MDAMLALLLLSQQYSTALHGSKRKQTSRRFWIQKTQRTGVGPQEALVGVLEGGRMDFQQLLCRMRPPHKRSQHLRTSVPIKDFPFSLKLIALQNQEGHLQMLLYDKLPL